MSTRAFHMTGSGNHGGGQAADAASRQRTRQLSTGVWLLLTVISMLFFLFLIALIARAQLPDWRILNGPGAPLANLLPLWLNTGLLAGACVSMQRALRAARRDDHATCRHSFLLAGLFALGFLTGQWMVWERFIQTGFSVHGNPANSFFFLLTGMHGLHLLGGLLAWLAIAGRVITGLTTAPAGSGPTGQATPVPIAHHALAIELCARYWHFLFVLWLALFLALTRSPETYYWIAAMCGLR